MKNTRLLGLDLLRMILAMAIVVYHYTWSGTAKGIVPDIGPDYLFYGRYAVPVFFIVSGFVIARTMAGRSWRAFLIARFVRLYPALIFCATVTFAVLLIGGAPIDLSLTRYFVALSFIGIGFDMPLIDPSYWTLVYEWRFYALAAVLILLGRAGWLLWLMTTFSVAGAISVVAGWRDLQEYIPFFMYAPFFAVGVIAAAMSAPTFRSTGAALIGLNLIAAIVMLPETIQTFLLDDVARQSVLECTVIVVGSAGLFIAFLTLPIPSPLAGFVRVCGAMSYPLYLVHQVVGYKVIRLLLRQDVPTIWAIIGAIAVSLVIAWVAAEIVERRMTPWLRGRLIKRGETQGDATSVVAQTLR